MGVFKYVQQNGKSKENNIFLLQSYIGAMTGQKTFTAKNGAKASLLQGLFSIMKLKSKAVIDKTTITSTDQFGVSREIKNTETATVTIK